MKILKSTISISLALIMSVIFEITSFAANLCTINVKGTIFYDKAFECLQIVNSERAKPEVEAEVVIEPDKTSQSISVPKTAYSKTINSKAFYLNAKAKTKLAYKSSNSKVATVTSNGKVTIKGIGKATITITAVETNNYEKAIKVTITAKPAKPKISVSTNYDKIMLQCDLDDNITGYQIAYKRAGESYKCKTYKGSSLTKKTLKGFSDGTYYVRIRTYKIADGKRVYSSWSSVKKINISL